jgi:gliding motility-associated-like protein
MRFFLSIIFLVCCCCFSAEAQVIEKFDFENYYHIPTGLGQWFNAQGVVNPSNNGLADPDYFHVLGNVACNLPETVYAIVPPLNGQGVMGLAVASTHLANSREYLCLSLPYSLQEGHNYKISIPWTNGVKTPVSTSGLSVSEMGVMLSEEMPHQNGRSPIVMNPQFVFTEELYAETWRTANIIFTCRERSNFLTIGLFGNVDNKAITNRGNANSNVAYYFFDAIQIERLADTVEYSNPILHTGIAEIIPAEKVDALFVPNSFTPNNDGTNDVFMQMDHEIEGWDLRIYNRWGQLVFESQSALQGWSGSEIEKVLEAEAFFYTLSFVNTQNLPVHQQGNVHLIR